MRALLVFILRSVIWAAMFVLFAGLIVRFTIRDSVEQLAVIFYATPWLVLTALSLVCTTFWLLRRKRIVGFVFVAITMICSGFWFQNKIHLHPQQAVSEKTLRFTYWNVGRPAWRLKGVLDVADSVNATVLAFGESQTKPKVKDPRWEERFSTKRIQWLRRGMLLAAREDIQLVENGSLKGRGDYEVCRIRHAEKEVYIMLVDFSPSPTRTRRVPFEKLYPLIEKYADKRLILAGDFNTPADSVYFDPVRAKLKNAFETAGRGNADTWPSLLPVLAIDQVWLSPGLRAVACKNRSSIYSDHCMVVTDIVVE